ncbi:class I adenylate-forming enzyme family protein [Halotalea alkalilenta]|uniref:Acetyl-CoA synthetase n=1 Tax=Halotalea alkalilenta TaxID=376489 RepID=A0A172YGH2_9GAMM|nr:class I adenylate-forming enzyme family protein [Halotalea alkalilenta]ANF58307.1 acetyl-CoA synthetase [Halotalea alkalilenta]
MNPSTRNLAGVLDASVDRDQLAFIGLDSAMRASRYSFGQLDELANAVARGLLARGYARGERIAILASNSVEYLAVVLGTMRAGLVSVPVNYKLPRALIEYVVNDSGARLLLCDQARLALAPDGVDRLMLEGEGPDRLSQLLDPGPLEMFQPQGEEPAMILYTSGSTGKPKGVVLSHAAHLWVVRTRLQATSLSNERALIAAPFYHMNALALALLSLASRATTVLLAQFTAQAYLQAIERYRCTWLTAVPPMIAMILREPLESVDLSSVRVVRMGSAPVSASLLEQIHRLLPNARVINAYGTTEGGPVVFAAHPAGLVTPPLAVGCAHPEVSLRLRDEQGKESDQGVLELKSPGLMSGYHHRPDLASPFTADGYYVTGDVFHRGAEGFYTFVGRRDDMFVSGGENIYPGEIEKMLEGHPAVQQACVVPVEDEIKGYKPVAFVVLRAQALASEEELKAFSLEHAAAYQHPRRIWMLDALPLAGTNKIDRHALRMRAAQLWKNQL